MACDGCDRSKAMGYKFCIKCGQSFAEEAPVPTYTVEKKGILDESVLSRFVIPSIALIIVSCIVSVALIAVDFGEGWDYITDKGISPWIYLGSIIKIAHLEGTAAGLFWLFLAIVAVISVALFIWQSKECFRFGEGYVERVKDTPLFWMGLLFGSVMVTEVLMNLVFTAFGMGVETPGWIKDMTLGDALVSFTNAAVWEEIMFRVMFLGLPVAIVALASREKGAWRYLLGGFGSSKLAVVFLIFSTLLFAFAHVDSWGVMKIFTVSLGGFMLGYMYMRFGLHVAIVCHLINDFSIVWSMGVDGTFAGLLLLAILGFGLVNLPLVCKKTVKGIRKVKTLPMTGFDPVATDVPDTPDVEVSEAGSPDEDDQNNSDSKTD